MREKKPKISIVIAGLFSLLFIGCSVPIQHGLSEKEANQIIVLLAKAKPPIIAQKMKVAEGREVKWSIVVPKSDAIRAIKILQAHNLPPSKEKGFSELYTGGSMIPTATEERAKFILALSGELVRTLKKIPGVLDARVHLMIPKEKILRRPNEQPPLPSASVLLVVDPKIFPKSKIVRGRRIFGPRDKLIIDVKNLVSGSVERLTPQRVSVVIRNSILADSSTVLSSGTSDADREEEMFTKVFTVRVHTEDAGKLKIILASIILVGGIFIVLTLLLFFRNAALKKQFHA